MVKSQDFYCVFGLKHLTGMDMDKIMTYFNRLVEFSKKYKPCDQCIILEFGKNNDNPHLNWVWEGLTDIHDTQLRREILNFYTPEELKKSNLKNLVSCGILKDKDKLVGGYLAKEKNSKVLLDDGFNVDECVEAWKLREDEHVKPKKERKISKIITAYNGVTVINDYIAKTGKKFPETLINRVDFFTDMVKEGYIFKVNKPEWQIIDQSLSAIHYGFTNGIKKRFLELYQLTEPEEPEWIDPDEILFKW